MICNFSNKRGKNLFVYLIIIFMIKTKQLDDR